MRKWAAVMGIDFNDIALGILENPVKPPSVSEDWPDPEALPAKTPPVEAFRAELLPGVLSPWIMDIADRMQCPPDFPAIGAIVALSSLIGRKIGIRPKRYDNWLVVPNLWGIIIGRPGIMKSPALDQALLPLKRIAIEAKRAGDEAKLEWEIQSTRRSEEESILREAIKKAVRDKADDQIKDLEKQLLEIKRLDVPPKIKRYQVNDSTVEKLGEILRDNPNGVLLFRDELSGWLSQLDREGHENDRSFYLEAWNGSGSYTYDRIGRGTIDIPSVCLSIIGGIQPGPLSEYVGTSGKGAGADGLLQRFQLAVWPDDLPGWKNVDRWPDTEAKNRAYQIFERFDLMCAEDIKAEKEGEDEIPFLKFDEHSQHIFDEWRVFHETKKLRSGEPEIIEAVFSKYRSLIPSLSLLFHLLEVGHGPIGANALLMSIDWSDYLESHVRRIYASGVPGLWSAHALFEKIRNGTVKDGMTLREIYLKNWKGLTKETLPAVIEVLSEFNIVRVEIVPTTERGGRPSPRIRLNPKIKGIK